MNIDDYPDSLACRAMPSMDGLAVEVSVGGATIVVPKEAVRLLNRPMLQKELLESDPVFSSMLGLGLLACQVIDTTAEIVTVKVPTINEPIELEAPISSLTRKVN